MKIPTCSKVSHCFLVDHLALESASPPGLFRARFGFHGMNADWFLETSFFSPILNMGRGGGSPFSQKLLLITFQDFGTTLSWDISHSAESRAEFFPGNLPLSTSLLLGVTFGQNFASGRHMYKALFNWPSRHLYLWFDTSLPSQVFISFGKPLRFSDSLIHCPCQSVLYLLKAEASGLTLT